MADKDPVRKPAQPAKPSREEEARQAAREYADDLRAMMEQLRRKLE